VLNNVRPCKDKAHASSGKRLPRLQTQGGARQFVIFVRQNVSFSLFLQVLDRSRRPSCAVAGGSGGARGGIAPAISAAAGGSIALRALHYYICIVTHNLKSAGFVLARTIINYDQTAQDMKSAGADDARRDIIHGPAVCRFFQNL
jgi:hypothetical protein